MMGDGGEFFEDDPCELREIQLRAFTRIEPPQAFKPRKPPKQAVGPVLVFDCETNVDAAQHLRFGTYQLRENGELLEAGMFYDPETLSDEEQSTLFRYARRARQRVITVREFVEEIFYDGCHKLYGTCVGFNLPFDLSRLAIRHATAQGGSRSPLFQNGFSLVLSNTYGREAVKVKHVSRRTSFIEFAMGKDPRRKSDKKKNREVQHHKGYFVDLKTLGGVLLAKDFSLKSLAMALGTPTQKLESSEHGQALTPSYISYAIRDTQATWECFEELTKRLDSLQLNTTAAHKLTSEASLGKAYLQAMGIKPWQACQPDFPPELTGIILSTYFGGRAEVHIRRQVCHTHYCDFLSMYPTVNTLMGLWRYLIAEGLDWDDATEETQRLINTWDMGQLQDKDAWKALPVLVQLCPDDDILPTRAIYGDHSPRKETGKMANIGLNRLTCDAPLWFTLADVLASKLLSGKTPKIMKALRFKQRGVQSDLRPVSLVGNADHTIDPGTSDFFREVINLRRVVKDKSKDQSLSEIDRTRFDGEQLALKILANSTSYGIFVEMNVQDLHMPKAKEGQPEPEFVRYGFDGKRQVIKSKVEERPGVYFHPVLATLITGAARLMLALAERRAKDCGLDWVFCDTDGIAFAKPDGMPEPEFSERVDEVRAWFEPLNPFEAKGSILQSEDENYARSSNQSEGDDHPQLFAYAVSAKRYALFNKLENGDIDLRKTSAHGLGLYLPPFKAPEGWERQSGSDYWQEEVWRLICEAALEGTDNGRLGLSALRDFDAPAASRYAANTPHQLRWFKGFNLIEHTDEDGNVKSIERPYRDRVKPFNFLLSFQLDEHAELMDIGRRRSVSGKDGHPRPAAPYDADPAKAAQFAFDRVTREPVPQVWLRSYTDVLRDYHIHDEAKFRGGAGKARGVLERRHVRVISVRHVGKEAHNWEEDYYVGTDDDTLIEHGRTLVNREWLATLAGQCLKRLSVREIRVLVAIGDKRLTEIRRDVTAASPKELVDLARIVLREGVGRK